MPEDRRDEARRQIAAGLDPAVEKKRARVAAKVAAVNTFKDVAEEWIQKCEREGRAEIIIADVRGPVSLATIIEVLSTTFGLTGAPRPRTPFEQQYSDCRLRSRR